MTMVSLVTNLSGKYPSVTDCSVLQHGIALSSIRQLTSCSRLALPWELEKPWPILNRNWRNFAMEQWNTKVQDILG